jgi:serine phosphatase RsbU (regulator of sigma subunit)
MKNSRKILFFFFFLSWFLSSDLVCLAQNKTIDSLLILLKKDKADTNKVIHLYKLINEYKLIGDFETGLNYGTEALELSNKIDFKSGLAQTSNCIGNIYGRQANDSRALEFYLKALKLYDELKNKKGIAICLGNIGVVYRDQMDYSKALDYYFKSLKINEEIKDKKGMGSNFNNIGIVYSELGNSSKALGYYFQALKIDQELGNKYGVATRVGNIGTVYNDLKDYPQALNYYFKALKMANQLDSREGVAMHLNNISSVYLTTGKYKEAEQYLKRAIILEDSLGTLDNLRESEIGLSQLYKVTKRYKEALFYYEKATDLQDTLFSQENKKQLVQKEMNYEFDKKEAITKEKNEAESHKQKIIILSVVSGLLLVVLFAIFILRSLRITRKQKQIIEQQKEIVEEHQKEIIDSINYAKRIQNALLREEEHISQHLPEHFILFLPKDIVSGDFYWGTEKQDYWYFAAVDCTGHGVPGAIMSMLGVSFLNDIISGNELLKPSEILDHLRNRVITELRQADESIGNKDGMDISLARLNLKTNELQWAGANNALNIIRNGQLQEVKADKQPIGYYPEPHPFTNHKMQMQKGDIIYIYSDGYADQFGGTKGKKFTYKRLENLLIANNQVPMKEQKEFLKKQFMEWKGLLEQVDDVCVFGVRV